MGNLKNMFYDFSKQKNEATLLQDGLAPYSNLRAIHFSPDFSNIKGMYDLGSGLVTSGGIYYLCVALTGGASAIGDLKYHGSGVGSGAANVLDTDITVSGGIPGRSTGTQVVPTTGTYQSVATQTYTSGGIPITEWGLFSQVTGGTLFDRKTFGAITVANGDSIQWTYSLILPAGS